MRNADDKKDGQASESETEGPLAGERLAEARRAQQIPVLEIAKELHLDDYKVRALEQNDFDVIGAPVFAKGHLRKYAQLVNVSEADVMADYYQLNRTSGAPPVVLARVRPRREMAPGPWVVVILLLVIVAIAYWWFANRKPVSEPPPAAEVAPLPLEAEPEVVDESTPEPVPVVAQEEVQESEPVAVPEVAADVDELSLSLTYSGDCWTEITDASGRRLFFDLGTSGRTVNVSGEAPFNVLFGNADNVRLEVNGDEYDIPAAERRGRTARMTITGS